MTKNQNEYGILLYRWNRVGNGGTRMHLKGKHQDLHLWDENGRNVWIRATVKPLTGLMWKV